MSRDLWCGLACFRELGLDPCSQGCPDPEPLAELPKDLPGAVGGVGTALGLPPLPRHHPAETAFVPSSATSVSALNCTS